MDMTRSGRWSALSLEGLLVTAIVIVAVGGVARPALGPAGLGLGRGPVFGQLPEVEATIDAAAVDVRTDPELPAVVGAVEEGEAFDLLIPIGTRVVVWSPDLRQRMALVATPVLSGLLTIGVLALLRITRTLRQGDPFAVANARRHYVIAGLVGLGGQATVLVTAWGRLGVLQHPKVAPYVVAEAEITLVPLVAGLGVAVAAEVFRQGARLRADVEGLV